MITAWESVVGEPVSPVCATTWSGSARSWPVSNDMLESLACGELELRNRFRSGRHHVGLLWPVTGRSLQFPSSHWKGQKGARCPRGSHMTDGRPQQPTTKQGDNGLQSWGLPKSPPVIVPTLLSFAVARPSPLRAISRSSWQTGRVQRADVAPCYQKPPNLSTPPCSPQIDIYGTAANSCNQMLPRDGTERHARLLYQLMIPSRTTGPQGDDLEPLSISGKQIPGRPRLAIWSGKQPGEDGTRRRSICCSVLPLQLAHHQSCRNVLHREVRRSRRRFCSQGWAAFIPTPNEECFAAKWNTSLVHWVARLRR